MESYESNGKVDTYCVKEHKGVERHWRNRRKKKVLCRLG